MNRFVRIQNFVFVDIVIEVVVVVPSSSCTLLVLLLFLLLSLLLLWLVWLFEKMKGRCGWDSSGSRIPQEKRFDESDKRKGAEKERKQRSWKKKIDRREERSLNSIVTKPLSDPNFFY